MREKKRYVVDLTYSAKLQLWVAKPRGRGQGTAFYDTKAEAIRVETASLRAQQPSQLVIHNKDGRIQSERTYGADPERRRG